MWTKQAPTEAGYYWARDEEGKGFVVDIWQSTQTGTWFVEYCGTDDGDTLDNFLGICHYEVYSIPLKQPE